jgi:hypothetical protein
MLVEKNCMIKPWSWGNSLATSRNTLEPSVHAILILTLFHRITLATACPCFYSPRTAKPPLTAEGGILRVFRNLCAFCLHLKKDAAAQCCGVPKHEFGDYTSLKKRHSSYCPIIVDNRDLLGEIFFDFSIHRRRRRLNTRCCNLRDKPLHQVY